MLSNLDSSVFRESAGFRDAEFQDVLTKIVYCYRLMLSNNVSVANAENKIRDELLINYLKEVSINKGCNYVGFYANLPLNALT